MLMCVMCFVTDVDVCDKLGDWHRFMCVMSCVAVDVYDTLCLVLLCVVSCVTGVDVMSCVNGVDVCDELCD